MQALRLVNTKELSHEEWLEWRQKGIGGSDVAAIFGLSRYRSPMHVYLDKIGELPPLEDNEKMKAGRKLEPIIAEWFAEETGLKVWRQNAIFQHPEHPFMMANIDRWLPGQNAGLEVKNTSEYAREDWSGTQAPTEYIMQCNHYMAVTGAQRWYIAVLIGGWDLQWRVIERNDELIRDMIAFEQAFWQEHVLAKVPPAFSHQDTEYLKDAYPLSNPKTKATLPDESYQDMMDLYEARRDLENAKLRKAAAENRIKGIMGEAEGAYYQGELKFTWKSNKAGVRSFKCVGGEE